MRCYQHMTAGEMHTPSTLLCILFPNHPSKLYANESGRRYQFAPGDSGVFLRELPDRNRHTWSGSYEKSVFLVSIAELERSPSKVEIIPILVSDTEDAANRRLLGDSPFGKHI